jgi:hypothetical protein
VALHAREWYYAGGWIRDLRILPRDDYTDRTWQLLFTFGLDARPQDVSIRSHTRGAGEAHRVAITPDRSNLQWLHTQPWRSRLAEDAPWALVLESKAPIVPSLTAAEFEPWSQGMPGAMGATALVPGPLTTEREWWLGIARHGGVDTDPVDWASAWQVFNPGLTAVRVTLRFHGVDASPFAHEIVVGPGAVIRVSADALPPLATGRPFVVSAEGDGPFVAQSWVRVGARGVPVTRAMASAAGVPIRLGGAAAAHAPAVLTAPGARSR